MNLRKIGGRALDGRVPGALDDDDQSPGTRSGAVPEVVVTGLSSDAHTWNLVYLQLLLEELGCRVTNLGPCTPDEVIVAECLRLGPDLVVVSSVNGHGGRDGARLAGAMRARAELAALPMVIGGQLDVVGGDGDTTARLLAAGYDAVFDAAAAESGRDVRQFSTFVRALVSRAALRSGPGPAPALNAVVHLDSAMTVDSE